MSLVRSALHLRTGETTAAEAISSWLRHYRVGGTDFSDAFEACVYLLEQSEQTPDLAFVGTDWLTPDEFPIIRYIHETWPGVGVIVYGDGGELPPQESGALLWRCRSVDALRQLLAESPSVLLQRLRQRNGDDVAPLPKSEPEASVGPLPQPAPEQSCKQAPTRIPDRACGPRRYPRADERNSLASRSVLTAEELAALLHDEPE